MQGVQRYVIFAYLAAAILVWITLSKLFAAIAYAVNAPDVEILGSAFTLSNLLALAGAAGAGYAAFKSQKAYDFCAEVIAELKKVTWPSKKETQTATVVVIVTTLIVAMILGLFDALWGALTGIIY